MQRLLHTELSRLSFFTGGRQRRCVGEGRTSTSHPQSTPKINVSNRCHTPHTEQNPTLPVLANQHCLVAMVGLSGFPGQSPMSSAQLVPWQSVSNNTGVIHCSLQAPCPGAECEFLTHIGDGHELPPMQPCQHCSQCSKLKKCLHSAKKQPASEFNTASSSTQVSLFPNGISSSTGQSSLAGADICGTSPVVLCPNVRHDGLHPPDKHTAPNPQNLVCGANFVTCTKSTVAWQPIPPKNHHPQQLTLLFTSLLQPFCSRLGSMNCNNMWFCH